ncbi:MAG TPA: hypothetical protein VLF20_01780 [Patescibacteria group bacterium]|nr:hypothetical protein [Patescibacteria group bacterium]
MTAKQHMPYKSGSNGYNHQSSRKTLIFVSLCILLITLFSTLALFSML